MIVFLAGAALFSAPGVFFTAEHALFWGRAEVVEGRVTRVHESQGGSMGRGRRRGPTTVTADVAYQLNGVDHLQPMEGESVLTGRLREGERLEVLVDPLDPKRMTPHSAASVFGLPVVAAIGPWALGLPLAFAAAFGPLPSGRKTRRAA